jgi:SAM-dependent methyltransferase
MAINLDRTPAERIPVETYAAAIPERLPLRHVDKVLLPGIVMHHTQKSPARLRADKYFEGIWGAGIWLASYILRHSEEFKDKRLLDIGTGSGIVAIAAALAGAEVTALDCNPLAICLTKFNAKANGVTIKTIEQYIGEDTPLADYDILTSTDTMYSEFVSNACIRTFQNQAKAMLANHAFYICDQSSWDERRFIAFRENILATGADFKIIEGGKKFMNHDSPINNNPVTAVRIEVASHFSGPG